MTQSGAFSGLNKADASGARYSGLKEGSYVVKVESMVVESTRKLGNCFFFEFEVTKSTNVEHPIGARRKWMQKLAEDTAFPNIKAFLYALLGRDPKLAEDAEAIKGIDEKAEEIMTKACTGNAFKGELVGVDVTQVQTKPKEGAPNGFPFQRHNWKPATAA